MPIYKKTNYSFTNTDVMIQDITLPNICPVCNHAIAPQLISLSLTTPYNGAMLFLCNACNTNFLSYFHATNVGDRNGFFRAYDKHVPVNFRGAEFSNEIKSLSPRFIEIYNQALHAETLGLHEVSGMGFRKSLEFLVKDYAIHKNPNDKEKIQSPKYSLRNCLNDYVNDERIKNPSIAAAWVGNDETHYTRIHEDKDINDLKKFINTVVYFIQYESTFDDASSFVGS